MRALNKLSLLIGILNSLIICLLILSIICVSKYLIPLTRIKIFLICFCNCRQK